jgi:hypothetical protein
VNSQDIQASSRADKNRPGSGSEKSSRAHTAQTPDPDKAALFAKGRLANAKKVFAHRGWDVLPQDERGRLILQWGADHAWLACPSNPKRSVRNWCRRWWPSLSDAELAEVVARTETSNKRWTHDQSAAVLEISVTEREELKAWFLGATDDPDYTKRQDIRRAKNAAKARKRRAANSTGTKGGRPALDLSPEERKARSNAQAAKRMKRRRALRKTPYPDISKILSNKETVVSTDIGLGTEFSVTDPPSRPRQAARRPAPIIIDIDNHDDSIPAGWGEVDRIDDVERAPFAGATGATKSPRQERRQ